MSSTRSRWSAALAVALALVLASASAVGGQATSTESFVIAAHVDFLDREPTSEELASWATKLDDGTVSRPALVRTLATSDEWLGAIVEQLYQDTLGRPSDSSGKAFWVEQLRTERYTVAQVTAYFCSSSEFATTTGGGTVEGWVTGLYLNLLGRSPDPAGLAYWAARADDEGRHLAAHAFFQGRESVRLRVTALYQELLGRDPEPAGLTFWSARVVERGDLLLAVGLASSAEYSTRAVTRFP